MHSTTNGQNASKVSASLDQVLMRVVWIRNMMGRIKGMLSLLRVRFGGGVTD